MLSEAYSLRNRFYLSTSILLDSMKNQQLLDSILKLTALDIKMGQIDRHNGNLMLQISNDNEETKLAPIYDYESSYQIDVPYPEFYFYDNPFLVVRKNKLSLSSLCRKFPQILTPLHTLRDIDIHDVVIEISKEKNITLSSEEINFYSQKDKEYNKVLKKL